MMRLRERGKKGVAFLLSILLLFSTVTLPVFAAEVGLSHDHNGTPYTYTIGYLYSGNSASANTREIFTQPNNYAIFLCPVCGQGGGSSGTALANGLYMPCYGTEIPASGGDGYIRYALVRHRHNNGSLADFNVYIPMNVPMYNGCYYSYEETPPTSPAIYAPDGWQKGSANFSIGGGTDSGMSLPDWATVPGNYGSGIHHYEYYLGAGWSGFPVGNANGTLTNGGTTTIYARAVDGAGNISPVVSKPVYIDTIAPNAPLIVPSVTSWTNQGVSTNVVSQGDTYSGVQYMEYSLDGGAWTRFSAPFVVGGHGVHNIRGRAIDNVGWVSAVSSNSVYVDLIAPVINRVDQTANDTHTALTLSVFATDADSGLAGYAVTKADTIPAAADFTTSSTLTVTENGTYYVWAKDRAGNTSLSKKEVITALDIVPPITSVETQQTWDANRNWAKISASDDNTGVIQIGWASSSTGAVFWQNAASEFTFEFLNNGTYFAFAKDLAGNVSAPQEFTIDKIDKHSPKITNVDFEKAWTQEKNVTISAHDTESGVAKYALTRTPDRPDLSAWKNENSFSGITENGTYYAWAKDNVDRVTGDPDNVTGSTSDPVTEVVINTIDRTKPVMDAINHSAVDNAPTGTAAYPYFNIVDRPELKAHDEGDSGWIASGIKEIQYQFVKENSSVNDTAWKVYDDTQRPAMEEEFLGSIVARAIDNAGNISDLLEAKFLFDKTKPIMTENISPANWTNQTVSISVVSEDVLSGVKSITLPDGSEVAAATAEYVVDKNGTYTFKATDNAGNVTEHTVEVKNINVLAPAVDFHFQHTSGVTYAEYGSYPEYYNKNIQLKAQAISFVQIARYEYQINDGQWVEFSPLNYPVLTEEQESEISVRVWDIAGNVSEVKSRHIMLDKTPPDAWHSFEVTQDKKTAIINFGSDSSICGVDSIVRPDGTAVYGVNGTSCTVNKNGFYTFVVTDMCGNRTTYPVYVDSIRPSTGRGETVPPPTSTLSETESINTSNVVMGATKNITLPRLALADLGITLFCIGLALFMILHKNKEEEEKNNQQERKEKRNKWINAALALISAILFFITQPLVWRFRIFDWWTLLFAIIGVLAWCVYWRTTPKKQKPDEKN